MDFYTITASPSELNESAIGYRIHPAQLHRRPTPTAHPPAGKNHAEWISHRPPQVVLNRSRDDIDKEFDESSNIVIIDAFPKNQLFYLMTCQS